MGRDLWATSPSAEPRHIDNKKKGSICSLVTINQDLSEEIERLVQRAEQDPRTHTFARLADLYRKTGDVTRALAVIERGLKHHPHYLNARIVHARVLSDLGRRTEARRAFERVLRIDSENLVAQAALAELGVDLPATNPRRGSAGPGEGAGWLARLDEDWQETRGGNGNEVAATASDGEKDAATPEPATAEEHTSAEEPGAEPPSPEARGPEEPSPPDRTQEPAHQEPISQELTTADGGLETATLAALYVRQGLFDRSIAIYERLLARDPYNVRLASALEDARRRTEPSGADPRDPRGAETAPAPFPTSGVEQGGNPPLPAGDRRRSEDAKRPAPAGSPRVPDDVAETDPSSESMRTILGNILDGAGKGLAPDAPGRWPEWLVRLGRGPG